MAEFSIASTREQAPPHPPLVRLGAIAYVNTLPIYYPLARVWPEEGADGIGPLQLQYATPAALNRAVFQGALDVSPVSSAFYLRHREQLVLLDDLSVSSPGAVESVLFISRAPLAALNPAQSRLWVPSSSETSIALLQHLLQLETGLSWPLSALHCYDPAQHLRQNVLLANGSLLDGSLLDGSLVDGGLPEGIDGLLVIGDDALKCSAAGHWPQGFLVYDLAECWQQRYGLPFVFAVWVARLPWAQAHPNALAELNRTLCNSRARFWADGELQQLALQDACARCTISPEVVFRYWHHCLDFNLGPSHLQSLERFQSILTLLGSSQPTVPFHHDATPSTACIAASSGNDCPPVQSG
ncbi:MAG: menaquinone biosynthesis protein [Candidatus Melainabacteria bacterium]|nr:menaquinone biosynthesis protein [Candidatus Melainabacteria bacterium]